MMTAQQIADFEEFEAFKAYQRNKNAIQNDSKAPAPRQEKPKAQVQQVKTKARNYDSVVVGNKLIITIDLTQDFGPSTSGKTILVSSSAGPHDVSSSAQHKGWKVNCMVYKPAR